MRAVGWHAKWWGISGCNPSMPRSVLTENELWKSLWLLRVVDAIEKSSVKHSTVTYEYWLTSRIRVLLEKLTGFQLAKKYPTFYGIRKFITAFTSAHHMSLSVKVSIQSRDLLFVLQHDSFHGRGVLSASPNPQDGGPPLVGLSVTAYSIYSQLRSISEAVPPSATWGRAMPWWQGPTYHGSRESLAHYTGRKMFLGIIW